MEVRKNKKKQKEIRKGNTHSQEKEISVSVRRRLTKEREKRNKIRTNAPIVGVAIVRTKLRTQELQLCESLKKEERATRTHLYYCT